MSPRKKPKKRGLHPIAAVLILLASIAFVAKSTMGTFGDSAVAEIVDLMDFGDGLELVPDVESQEEVVWADLLAEHGSFDGQRHVRLAFFSIAEGDVVPAAPGVETAPVGSGRWVGSDPPLLRLGVVMVSGNSRRAVLAGRVVGVGDAVAGGEVVAIESGTLRLRWQHRNLTYDLDSEVPREFRAEHGRRNLDQQQSGGRDEQQSAQDLGQGKEDT